MTKETHLKIPHLSLETLLWITISLGIILRFLALGSREFWYDEVLSLLLANGQKPAYQTPGNFPILLADFSELLQMPLESNGMLTLKNLFRGLAGEPHPPLFFIAQHFWLRLFGNSEMAMRSLGVLLSFISLFFSYQLGLLLGNHRQGLILAALLSVNPFFLFQSLNIRMYGLLVLWVILSTLASLSLLTKTLSSQQKIIWQLVLTFSVAGCLLTFYQSVYLIIALAALALYLKPAKFFTYSLSLAGGFFLTLPWMLWGFSQQLRNADLQRFQTSQNWFIALVLHLRDVLESLSVNLLIGDWQTSLPLPVIIFLGSLVALGLISSLFLVYKHQQKQLLIITLTLTILPLLIALIIDILTQKYTLATNSKTIIILPGSLLLITLSTIHLNPLRQKQILATLLSLYLTLSIGDLSLRHRQMFHSINSLIQQNPTAPTLIALNTRAWGHILRLAYYIKPRAAVMLLAQESANLAPTLEKLLNNEASVYQRIIWLDVAAPIWSPPSTFAQKKQVETVLNRLFQLTQTQQLFGTQDLDQYILKLYQRP